MAAVFLGEPVGPRAVAGAALILAGAALIMAGLAAVDGRALRWLGSVRTQT